MIWNKYGLEVNDWDGLLLRKFMEHTQKGGAFCDVGACNGLFTSLFKSIAGPNGMVYSFELNPHNYFNIKHLESENCVLENKAVSDRSGTVSVYAENTASSNFTSNIMGNSGQIIGVVDSVSLDEYFADKRLDYLKIDVEGAETKVIKGAISTLKTVKYAVVECHYKKDWQEIFDMLSSNDFQFRNMVDDELVAFGPRSEVPGIMENGMPYQMYLLQNEG